MPRPGTPLIHPRVAEHLRPVAERAMTARVTISRPGSGTGTFNPTTGKTATPAATAVWSGPARVQQMEGNDRPVDFGGQPITLHRYRISVPADTPEVRVDDSVKVDESTGDPHLDGHTMRVLDVNYGSVLLQRDLVCEHNLG